TASSGVRVPERGLDASPIRIHWCCQYASRLEGRLGMGSTVDSSDCPHSCFRPRNDKTRPNSPSPSLSRASSPYWRVCGSRWQRNGVGHITTRHRGNDLGCCLQGPRYATELQAGNALFVECDD